MDASHRKALEPIISRFANIHGKRVCAFKGGIMISDEALEFYGTVFVRVKPRHFTFEEYLVWVGAYDK